ncbi:MAG TPA: hypothetical protein VIL97_01580, partial [Thermoanaerobaculia bacterium]
SEFASTAERLRVPPAAVDSQTLRRFTDTGDRQDEILRNLTSDLSAASLAKSLAAQKVNMLTVVALNGLERAQQIVEAGNELPPPERVAGEVIRAYLGEIDRALGEIADAAPGATLFIVSPSGALPPPLPASSVAVLRSLLLIDDPGSDDGFLLIRGEGALRRENPAPAEVVDVVPTLLFSAGLPVSRDMDGRLLTEAFQEQFLRTNPLSIIQTYETERLIIRREDVVENHRVSHRVSERL